MGGASFEATLEVWASSLRDAKARTRHPLLQEQWSHARLGGPQR